MKIYKMAAVVLAAFLLFAGYALAAENIDVSRDVSLTVQFQNDGTAGRTLSYSESQRLKPINDIC